jgi:hypothetical protein
MIVRNSRSTVCKIRLWRAICIAMYVQAPVYSSIMNGEVKVTNSTYNSPLEVISSVGNNCTSTKLHPLHSTPLTNYINLN